ncbi:MAG: hypothetical protein C0603_06055 [Denitrovibrio sp.]|nr:MAG: hypothetical protein C0603_06055 [Denitrovibrio sp.]
MRMRDQVRSAESFVKYIFKHDTKDEIRIHLEALTSSFHWDNNSSYFFVISKDGTILHHGGNENVHGKNINILKKDYSKLYTFLYKVYKTGGAFGEYDYVTPDTSDNPGTRKNKIAYAKYNKDLGLLIGTSVYEDSIDTIVKNEIVAALEHERFGFDNYGYFWIFTTDYETVFHINPNLYTTDLYNLQDSNGKYLFREFLKIAKENSSGYTEYYWTLPGASASSQKISYLTYIKEWDWIIGTGFYFENLALQMENENKVADTVLSNNLRKVGFVIALLFILVTLISIFIYKRIRHIEDSEERYTNDLLQYKIVIDKSALVSITDTKGIITHVNDQYSKVTGYATDKFIGKKHNLISHPDTPRDVYKELWETIKKGKIWRGIIKNLTAGGDYFYQKSTIVPFRNKHGKVIKYISVSHDVTEVFENKTKLQQYLSIDDLTGLGNRTSLLKDISTSKSADLAIIDIDGFHTINENYGMKAGDDLLIKFSKRLTSNSNIRVYDIFRLHSDVFAILSTNSNKETFIANVEKGIASICKDTITLKKSEILIRTFVGYAHGSQLLLSHADAALQFAKANNVSHYIYDPLKLNHTELYEKNTKTLKLLSWAIEEDKVVPFFQPIVGVNDKTKKYECLMRIIDQEDNIISPFVFLDISKQTRFYPYLTRIIIKKSIDTFTETDSEFSINMSSEDILNTETMNFLYSYANEKKVMDRLIIEIVETESISESTDVAAILQQFKDQGARIAIDDFGTGYYNFDYLLKIKADYIKIDGSIIKLIAKDERAQDVVHSIVSYAQKLNMETIAEFISDETLEKAAIEMGIDYLQGYHLGKPEPKPVD